MCQIDAQEGSESLVTIGAVVLEIHGKVWRGGVKKAPHHPPGRGLRTCHANTLENTQCAVVPVPFGSGSVGVVGTETETSHSVR